MFICEQKNRFISTIFLEILQKYTNLFGYVRHAWVRTPKMIVSASRELRYLSARQKYTSPFASFLRYYILKNPWIWLTKSILVHDSSTRILSDMRFVVKYQQQFSFHCTLFQKYCSKKSRHPISRSFWALFAQIYTKMNFS